MRATTDNALILTLAYIADPARWTRGVRGRYGRGIPCEPNHPEAHCWCLSGALERAILVLLPEQRSTWPDCGRIRGQARHRLSAAAYALKLVPDAVDYELTYLNDRNRHEAVVKMLEYALDAES